jgi:hypothetical protein
MTRVRVDEQQTSANPSQPTIVVSDRLALAGALEIATLAEARSLLKKEMMAGENGGCSARRSAPVGAKIDRPFFLPARVY